MNSIKKLIVKNLYKKKSFLFYFIIFSYKFLFII